MSGDRGRTSLTRYAGLMNDPNPEAARLAARNSYIATGGDVVLINRQWLNNWADKTQLDLLAEKALGVKRMGK